MSFDPSRHNFAGLGGRKVAMSAPTILTECCQARILPQMVEFHGETFEEGTCERCAELVCAGCGGPLDPGCTPVE